MSLKYIRQENSGISAAKNLGMFASEGRIIFFFDDDDCAHQDLLLNHLKMHKRWRGEETAVLGYTTWFPGMPVTPVMHYITEVGSLLFSYRGFKNGQVLDFTYFWGGRSSCKRSFLIRHGIFNQDFRFGSEDIELGYRLSKFNLKVVHSRACISYMKRPITYEQFCNRCERQGQSQYLFSRLHPAPQIQQYCLADEARHQWRYIHENFDNWFSRAKEIEALLTAGTFQTRNAPLLQELFRLYRQTFIGSKIKGFIDAERSSEKKPASHDCDFLHYEQKRAASQQSETRPIEGICASRETGHIPAGSTTPRTRVLIVHRTPPLYDRASGELRIYNLVRILREHGHHVTYVCQYGQMLDDIDLSPYISALSGMGVLVHTLDTPSRQLSCSPTPDTMEAFAALLRENKYDVALLHFFTFARNFIPRLRSISPRTRIVVDSVDVHFVREARRAIETGNPDIWADYKTAKEEELSSYRSADAVLTVTDDDRQALERYLPERPVYTVPDPHKSSEFVPDFSFRRDILFLAGFTHAPNIDAALYFHQEVWPLLHERLPDLKWYIVGSNPPDQIRALSREHIIVTGYIPDIGQFLRHTRVAVAPLRYGAGMKGKIAVSMAQGLPTVTTEIGAEGMGLVNGREILIARNPNDFCSAIEKLYNDEHLWKKISDAGREHLQERFGDTTVYERLKEALRLFSQPEDHSRALPDPLRLADILSEGYHALTREGNLSKAENSFMECLAIQPDNEAAITGLALSGTSIPGASLPEEFLQNTLAKAKRAANLHVAYAKVLESSNRIEVAEQHMNDALHLEPHNSWVLNEAALFFIRRGNTARASLCFSELADLFPDDVESMLKNCETLAHLANRDLEAEMSLLNKALKCANRIHWPDMAARISTLIETLAPKTQTDPPAKAPASKSRRFSARNIGWKSYDDAYQVWKQRKMENIEMRRQTLKQIGDQYGVCLFFLLYPLYKTVKPFRKLIRKLAGLKRNRSPRCSI
jgi:glycosyltransferase involved in cell wall biosynthesis